VQLGTNGEEGDQEGNRITTGPPGEMAVETVCVARIAKRGNTIPYLSLYSRELLATRFLHRLRLLAILFAPQFIHGGFPKKRHRLQVFCSLSRDFLPISSRQFMLTLT